MPNTTKAALEESLKRLLLKKPLDKITITDITTDCGISRMAFYYHFKDIYDLVEWSCVEDGTKALQGKKTSESWTEGLTQIFGAVLENKPFIMNVYRNVDRERIENYLFKLTYDLIVGVVEEKSKGLNITEEDKKFIPDSGKYIDVKVNGSNIQIPFRKIIYAEHFSHMIHIHTAGERELVTRQSFDSFITSLKMDSRFYQCNRGVVINLEHAVDFDGTGFRLDNGSNVPVSRKLLKNARQTFMEFLFQRRS